MGTFANQGRVWAVLGPTNTGKTYLAIDRMLGHATGMIGFPLRLLARENYDRIVALKGRGSVALITGEEKIIPKRPRWYVCTVESMPLERRVDFLAIDEVQLCADPERGHVFTDRVLHARGIEETMFMGADTIAPMLRILAPNADLETRPRFSILSYAGTKKLTRLPRRSAIVAFSVAEVYALAERVRRHRGGTAVVLGALSPRTRNAQVEMYQAGEVDYMVATDAVGMGLNMDVDHVAFAGLRKFDGHVTRMLSPAETGQIAGRAGRYLSDGSFGVTNDAPAITDEVVTAIESHHYEPLDHVYWRNRNLEFRSPRDLLRSLTMRPPSRALRATQDADDHTALLALSADPEILARSTNPAVVRLLWEVCQIPDFRKVTPDIHATLLRRIFLFLSDGEGRLPNDWVAAQVSGLDNITGDIDALTQRIAHIRTWTYISHRADWLVDSEAWRDRARRIEDNLSDALHDRLTQRFVDRHAPIMVKQRLVGGKLDCFIDKAGDVVVEGASVGAMAGLRFEPDATMQGEQGRVLISAARGVIEADIQRRVREIAAAPDAVFSIGAGSGAGSDVGGGGEGAAGGRVAPLCWNGVLVAELRAGENALSPQILVSRNEFLDGPQRERVRARLSLWMSDHTQRRLGPLFQAKSATLSGTLRGVVYQLSEALGSAPREAIKISLDKLSATDRKALAKLGVRTGLHSVYFHGLLNSSAIRTRAILASVYCDAPDIPRRPKPARAATGASKAVWAMMGFQVVGGRALRVDVLEKVAALARKLARVGAFAAPPEMLAMLGCSAAEVVPVMRDLGYRAQETADGVVFQPKKRRRQKHHDPRHNKRREEPMDPHSPFAKLRELAGIK